MKDSTVLALAIVGGIVLVIMIVAMAKLVAFAETYPHHSWFVMGMGATLAIQGLAREACCLYKELPPPY